MNIQTNYSQLNNILLNSNRDKNDIFNVINPPQQEINTDRPWWDQTGDVSIFERVAAMGEAIRSQYQGKDEATFNPNFIRAYLQYPNEKLQKIADVVTHGLTKNDDKATAIVRAVELTIGYKTDMENYGVEELWVPTLQTILRGYGDCEDQSFVIHSLLLHAGIPHDRIRTYGGYVDDGEGNAGDHAWTAYRRESDNQWVILDTAYYPSWDHVDDRPLMRNADFYKENYFWFNQIEWHSLTNLDMIHNPGATYNVNGIIQNKFKTLGYLVNIGA